MLASRRHKLLAILVAAALVGLVTLASGLASAAPNPPGNNGTIKIDDTPFDDAPDNEPHVGCVFQVDFYGYDEGDPVRRRHLRVASADRPGRDPADRHGVHR
jgi:hypothetical protein